MTDKPDWIDEAFDDIAAANTVTILSLDEMEAVVRRSYLEAARCPRCGGIGTFPDGGICLKCLGTKLVVPTTKGTKT